jgi:hypothetical protein
MLYLARLLSSKDDASAMRTFQELNRVVVDEETQMIQLSSAEDSALSARITMRQEGSYLAISMSYGITEIAMRLRIAEFVRVLHRLQAVEGLQTTRQIGTGQAYIAVGLQGDYSMVVRPTIVADATGYICFNLILSSDVRNTLMEWLPSEQIDRRV